MIRSSYRNVIRPVCVSLCLFSISAVLTLSQSKTSTDAVVITVGDLKLTAGEVEKIVASLPPQNRQYFASPAGRAQLADFLVRTKLFVREAEKRHLEDREDIKRSMALFRESLLSREVEKELVKEIKVTDEEARQFLDTNSKSFEQAKVRRIVVRSASTNQFYSDGKPSDQLPSDEQAKAKAEDIRKKIAEGANFEEMAAKFSDDPMTSGKGGDMGYVRRVNIDPRVLLTPPMLETIFSLKAGETSQVIQTPFGFEMFNVEELKSPKLEEVRQEVENGIRQQKYEMLYQELKARSAVKVDEAYFGIGTPGAPTQGQKN
ncbi:MAG: peptidylprolyl isomerase [Terriglobia bacterium]